MWGKRDAPVTIAIWSDFQCPFCSKVEPTLQQVKDTYGPDKVRIVWKNNPLPFHQNAKPAAEAAQGVFALGGQRRVLEVARHRVQEPGRARHRQLREVGAGRGRQGHGRVQGRPRQPQVGRQGRQGPGDRQGGGRAGHAGVLRQRRLHQRRAAVRQVQEDDRPGASEGPGEDRGRYAEGPRSTSRCPRRTRRTPRAAKEDDEKEKEDTTTVFKVPVGSSPMLGNPNALVTIVEFSDFQCPFCSRVEPTLKGLRDKYGDKVRLVWKNEPLPFHPGAEPAAEAAMEAARREGRQGLLGGARRLFGNQKDLVNGKEPNVDGIVKLATDAGAQRRQGRGTRSRTRRTRRRSTRTTSCRRTSRPAARRTSSSTAGASSARSRRRSSRRSSTRRSRRPRT